MEKMDWFHRILYELYDNDAFNNEAINVEQYIKEDIEKSKERVNDENRIKIACERIEKAGFAEFDPKVTGSSNIRGKLHLEGYNYVLNRKDKYELEKSIKDTNQSSRSTNFWMRLLTFILAGAAILTLVLELCKLQGCGKRCTNEQTKTQVNPKAKVEVSPAPVAAKATTDTLKRNAKSPTVGQAKK